MRNLILCLAAVVAAGILSAQVNDDLRGRICAYRNSLRAEMQQVRSMERELAHAAQDLLRAQAMADRQMTADRRSLMEEARRNAAEIRAEVRDQIREAMRQVR